MSSRPTPRRQATALLALLLLACGALEGQDEPAGGSGGRTRPEARESGSDALLEDLGRLPPKYREWVLSVRGLITREELRYFLDLTEDYRRDVFMDAFWGVRDPDPRTPQNELRDRWRAAVEDGTGIPFEDPRFLLYLLNGPPGGYALPNGQAVERCFSRAKELEIWFYGRGWAVDRELVVIFQRRATGAPYEVYRPGASLRPVQRTGGLPTSEIRALCADELLRYAAQEIRLTSNYDGLLERALTPPLPSAEWLADLRTSATELPEGAATFAVDVEVRFPARRQSRTALDVMLVVPVAEAPGRRFEGELFHHFLAVGEVIRDGRLFETFRYRFEGRTPEGVAHIPLGFTRYLRPGPATLRVLLKDVFGERFALVAREIEIPSPDDLPAEIGPEAAIAAGAEAGGGQGPSLRLLPPSGDALTGPVRFHARADGSFDKVTFYLDGRAVLSKRRPPYSVELDLGPAPVPRRVRVVGFVGEREAATDQIWLNQRARRFAVRLIEPRSGGIYPGSLTARVDVVTPDGLSPERLELFVDGERVAVLEEPPWVRVVELPGQRAAVVRAVGYLADGTSAEDAVVVNASAFVEEVEVRLVELWALVLDSAARPILDLEREDFRVFEDGVPQRIGRFGTARQAPVNAALLIDRSASMAPHLERVTEAAAGLARAAASSREDRVAVFSFAERLSVDADFAAGAGAVERALAGLEPGGGTALHDALVRALELCEGVRGPRALLLFSDGRDEDSRLSYEQTLEAARRAGAVLYAVGLRQSFAEGADRRPLEELAAETGGRTFFLDGLDELDRVYGEILEELRSGYVLAYQPTAATADTAVRTLRVEVGREGAEVRTRRRIVR